MRSLKLATLLLLAGSVSFACSSEEGDDGGPSLGASPGTGGSDAGSGGSDAGSGGTTGGDGDGDGGTQHPGCTNTVTASGTPTMIDNFDHGSFPNFVDDSDGRVGTWEHEYWNPEGGDRLFQQPEHVQMGMGGAAPGHMRFACDGSVDEAWCATDWNANTPWGQWADTSTRFTTYSETDVNCYDASQFSGIKFKAKSADGSKILIKLNTPEVSTQEASDAGWAYKSKTLTLPTDWETFEIPFASMVMPEWAVGEGAPAGAVPAAGLISMAIVIRSVTDESGKNDAGMETTGEALTSYDVEIDDVEFY